MKFYTLEIRQLHLAFGKHGADNFVAVRKVEAVKIHFGEGVIFQTALFQRVDRVREGTVGHQRCPLDFLQTAVLKIQRLHRRMGAAQTCDLTPHELALVQRGMIQFAFGKGAIHKHAVGKVAILKSLLGERQVSKPFTLTITLCHKILLSVQFFRQCRAAFQHILPGSFKIPGIPRVGHIAVKQAASISNSTA